MPEINKDKSTSTTNVGEITGDDVWEFMKKWGSRAALVLAGVWVGHHTKAGRKLLK